MKYNKEKNMEIESLKEMVNSVFETNIMKNKRNRNSVDGRIVYSKILRDKGYTFELIGESLNKDHSTIVHYLSNVDFILRHDPILTDNYLKCKEMFKIDKHYNHIKTEKEKDLELEIMLLKNQIEEMKREKEEKKKENKKYDRIFNIINFIESNTPKGTEEFIMDNIKKLFNTLQYG